MDPRPARKAVFFFCAGEARDPVAPRVFSASTQLFNLVGAGFDVDDWPVLHVADAHNNIFYYVRTSRVLSHDYKHYLPILNGRFSDFDLAGVVNWHGGTNAPDRILTVHTTGDVISGHFGAANPVYVRNLLRALDQHRIAAGLNEFRTTTEATHWSGIPNGGDPAWIVQFKVPLVDVEIGSTPISWSNQAATEAVARSLVEVFSEHDSDTRLRSLLCVGGVHLEASFPEAVLTSSADRPIAVSHILPNQWLAAGGYDTTSGLEKLAAAARSITDGVHCIAFHDDLKGKFKAQLKSLGEQLGVPVVKRQALKNPSDLPLW